MTTATGVTWDLSFFYKGPDDGRIDDDLAKADDLADKIANNYRQKIVKASAEDIADLYRTYEETLETMGKPHIYALLYYTVDSQNSEAQSLLSRVEKRVIEVSNKLVFIDLELNQIENVIFAKLLNNKVLAEYRHQLELVRLNKPYLLGEEAEQVLMKKKLTSLSAWDKFYEEYTASFEFAIEIDGEKKILTDPQVRNLFTNPDRDLRERVFKTYYIHYEKNRLPLKHIFNNAFMDHTIVEELRGYEDPMVPAFLRDQVEGKIIRLLMDVTRRNYPILQEYYRLKAKILGLPKVMGWDILAPYPLPEKTYDWETAKDLVLKSYGEFSPQLKEIIQLFIDGSWIDAEVRKGKRGGAACWTGTPRIHPWVYLSFEGKLTNVTTLAHELGHGIHNYLAGQSQNYFNKKHPTVLGETASIFGEMLLTNKLLGELEDTEEKKKLLMDQLDDFHATVFRQVMYTRWEFAVHEKGKNGSLSDDDLRKTWAEHVNELYGDAVEFPPVMDWAFLSISHFISYLYYCYSYAFGQLFVVSLYQKYLEEGEAFVPKYMKLLEAGGCDFPANLARDIGIDLTDDSFWQGGFDYFESLIEELKKLVGE